MLHEEAKWLGRHLSLIGARALSPLCNIGSASEDYRRFSQSYIDREIFLPMRLRDIEVVHVDVKAELGVDLVGDLTDPTFVSQLRTRTFNSVMCCNLLEHVTDRPGICDTIGSIVVPRGYVIVSVPRVFPYHEDPIDTMFRPTIRDIATLFPGCELRYAAMVRASRYTCDFGRNPKPVFWLFVRACLPFYRPPHWWRAVKTLFGLFRGYKVTCLILQRRSTPEWVSDCDHAFQHAVSKMDSRPR